MRVADARVIGDEDVAPEGQLGGGAHRVLGALVDAARGDGVDVHAELAQRAHRLREGRAALVVGRRIGHPEHEARGVGAGAPRQLRRALKRLIWRLGEVATAASAQRGELLLKGGEVAGEVDVLDDVLVALVAIPHQRPPLGNAGVRGRDVAGDRPELLLQPGDLVAHASGGVDDQHQIERSRRRPGDAARGLLLSGREVDQRLLLPVAEGGEEREVEAVVPDARGERARRAALAGGLPRG